MRVRSPLAVVVASGLVVASFTSFAGAAPTAPTSVGVNVPLRATGDLPAVRGREIPGLAVDPSDPRHVVEIDEDFINGHCTFNVTFDGGETWTGGQLQGPADFPSPPCVQFDFGGYAHSNGSVVWGSGQNVYTTFSSRRSGETESVLVAKSSDGGRTFAPAVVAIPGTPGDRPIISIRPRLNVAPHPSGDKVYVVAIGCDFTVVPGGGACNRTTFAASTDAGATWRSIRSIALPIEGVTSGHSQPAIGPDGTVYVALRRGVAVSFPRNLFMAVSKDDGVTWTFEEIGEQPLPVDLKLVADRTGGLYLAMVTGGGPAAPGSPPGDGQDITLLRRPAGSATWSSPVRVNDDKPGTGVAQRGPMLSVSPEGVVELAWRDTRHPYPGQSMEDYYYAASTDGGATFGPNRRLTDRHRNLAVGLNGRIGGASFYWPALVALGDGRTMAAWGDSREGNFDTDTEDIYLATLSPASAGPLARQEWTGDAAELSVALSGLAYPGGVETVAGRPATKVVIARDDDVAGLLAGSVLARASIGPVLVTDGAGLSASVQREVRRLSPVGAFVVGTEAEVGAGVVRDLTDAGVAEADVIRVAGADRADTIRQVAQKLDTRTEQQKSDRVAAAPAAVIVNPDHPTAAAAGAFAASLRLPVLVSGQDSLPTPTKEALQAMAIPATIVVGGTDAVGDAVLGQLPQPKRVGEGDASTTAGVMAIEGRDRGLPMNIAYVADSDAPAVGALLAAGVARRGGFLVLAPGADPEAAEAQLHQLGLRDGTDRLVVVSGRSSSRTSDDRAPAPAVGGQLPATGGAGTLTLGAVLAMVGLAVRRRLRPAP